MYRQNYTGVRETQRNKIEIAWSIIITQVSFTAVPPFSFLSFRISFCVSVLSPVRTVRNILASKKDHSSNNNNIYIMTYHPTVESHPVMMMIMMMIRVSILSLSIFFENVRVHTAPPNSRRLIKRQFSLYSFIVVHEERSAEILFHSLLWLNSTPMCVGFTLADGFFLSFGYFRKESL